MGAIKNRTTAITDKNDNKKSKPESEHLHAEVESLRSMLHRWFGIKKTETGEEPAEQEPDEISDSQHRNSRES